MHKSAEYVQSVQSLEFYNSRTPPVVGFTGVLGANWVRSHIMTELARVTP